MKEASRRVSDMERLFRNSSFDTDFDMEKELFDTIQLCSPLLLDKVSTYSTKRKSVDIFNKYVTGVMELKRYYAALREYQTSIREQELINHPNVLSSFDANFDRDHKLLSLDKQR